MDKVKVELSVVIPVYNEEEIIASVLDDWSEKLKELEINYQIHAYNDGSKDNSLQKLYEASLKDNRIIVHDKLNSGHGPTILGAYKDNSESEWIFQVDSDNEMEAKYFATIWHQRGRFDFLIGKRESRVQPWPRKIISWVSRQIVWRFYNKGIWDVNSPYRLMKADLFKKSFCKISENTFAPNVIVSGIACKKRARIFECQVPHSHRQTGEVSIKKWKLFKASLRSCMQTILFSFKRIR